jgi:23S rRNA pseudouridine955/2504/2580 synthase
MQRILKVQWRTFATSTTTKVSKSLPRISKTKLTPIDDNKASSLPPSITIVQPKTKTRTLKTVTSLTSTTTPTISSSKTVTSTTTPTISSILPLSTLTPSLTPDPLWLQSCIRFEDDDLVIISKPTGIASQPGGSEPAINDYLDTLEDRVGSSLRVVHRLDVDTSGLLMLARSKESAAAISEGLRYGKIRKHYIGLSLFPPSSFISSSNSSNSSNVTQGICKEPIIRTQWKQGMVNVIESSEQWDAETLYKATTLSSGFTIWRLSPLTGRRHQLRQHVLHLTNKIGGLIGDTKYFGKNKNDQLSSSLGLMLHAYELCIPARTLGNHQVRDLIIREELPTRMQKIFRKYNIPSRILATALEE